MRVAVIGVGHLGRHHARILSATPGVELVGIVDIDEERAAHIAAEYRTTAYTDWRRLEGQVDAVSIAAPTERHLEIAEPLLRAGVHALVEKPMTRTLEEADALMAAASAGGAVLAIGHTERFNPAVAQARSLVREPRFIEVHRLGTFPDRSLDIDVVFDLMIHDLDLLLDITGDEVVAIEAVGVPVLTPRIDIANARLRFSQGCVANLTASRISRDRVRKFRVFQQDAYVSVDYAAQELEVWRLVSRDGPMPAIEGGKYDVRREEPLKRELEDFVAAVRDRRAPLVTGQQGRAALALAQRIVDRMAEGN